MGVPPPIDLSLLVGLVDEGDEVLVGEDRPIELSRVPKVGFVVEGGLARDGGGGLREVRREGLNGCKAKVNVD